MIMGKRKLLLAGLGVVAIVLMASCRVVLAQTQPGAIIDQGRTTATIYYDEKSASSVGLAATELQNHLREMTGVTVPIGTDATQLKGFVIYLGDNAFARKNGIETGKLPHDGYRIVSTKSWMIIAGRDYDGPVMAGFDNPFRINESYNPKLKIGSFGDAGTLFGVYHFLERYGVRWYMPGKLGTIIPKATQIAVPALNITQSPVYEYRFAYYGFPERSDDDTLWYRRSGFGAPAPVQIQHSFGHWFHKYKDTNPEYFALIGGQRDFTTLSTLLGPGGYNLSNPGLIQRAIDTANKYFDENPEQMIFPLAPEDGMRLISEDPESQAQLDKNSLPGGEFSNYVWGFVNKVAIEVARKHPDKYIGCFAYEKYSLPPTNIARLSPNVAVMITKFRSMYPDPEIHAKTVKKITDWSKKASTLYSWEYYCNPIFNPGWQGYPMYFSKLLQDDLKMMKGLSKGEFIEAESWLPEQYSTAPEKIVINRPGLEHPLLYLTARLLWNPDLDLKTTLDEYYRLFYGPAEVPMRGFWELIEANWMKKGWSNSPNKVYDTATINKLIDYIKEAQAKSTPGTDYRARVDMILSEFGPAAEVAQRLGELADRKAEVPTLPTPQGITNAPLLQLIDRNFLAASPATNVRLGWDKQNLYIDMSCHEPAMDKLQARATKRDSSDPAIWDDDDVEIFISPDATNPWKAFQYIINPAGAFFDGKYAGKDTMLNHAWNGDAKVTVKKEAARWTVHLAIPWTELGVQTPTEGYQLKANFYRGRRAGGQWEQSSWAALLEGNFYSPESFGTLTLSEEKPVATLLPALIKPAALPDYGSGPPLKGHYHDGGLNNVGLFIGQPNSQVRNDRALFRFNLRPLLEAADKVQKVELLCYPEYVVGTLKERTIEVDHFNIPVPILDVNAISTEEVEWAGSFIASKETTTAAARANKVPAEAMRIDVTALVKGDLAKGHVSTTFRWRDVLAEKEGNLLMQPVGITLSAQPETMPSMVITLAE
jgi:hypothetical protein